MIGLEDAPGLPTIDVATPFTTATSSGRPRDRRAFEERYAELGFGLGVVPRRLRRDEPFWETPAGVLATLATLLALLGLLASAR